MLEHHYHIHLDPEAAAFFRGLDLTFGRFNERMHHVATQDQVNKLTADVQALIAAIDAFRTAVEAKLAAAQAGTADPAIDSLNQTVEAKTAEVTAATPTG